MYNQDDLELAKSLFPNATKIVPDYPSSSDNRRLQDPHGIMFQGAAWFDREEFPARRVVTARWWHNRSYGPWPERRWNAYGPQGDFSEIPEPDLTPYAVVVVDGYTFSNRSANMAVSVNWGRVVTFICFISEDDYAKARAVATARFDK